MSSHPDQFSQNLLDDFKESNRLRSLSNEELVAEAIDRVETDLPMVAEICRRLCPEYFDAMDEAVDERLEEEDRAITEMVNQL